MEMVIEYPPPLSIYEAYTAQVSYFDLYFLFQVELHKKVSTCMTASPRLPLILILRSMSTRPGASPVLVLIMRLFTSPFCSFT